MGKIMELVNLVCFFYAAVSKQISDMMQNIIV